MTVNQKDPINSDYAPLGRPQSNADACVALRRSFEPNPVGNLSLKTSKPSSDHVEDLMTTAHDILGIAQLRLVDGAGRPDNELVALVSGLIVGDIGAVNEALPRCAGPNINRWVAGRRNRGSQRSLSTRVKERALLAGHAAV